MIKELSEWELSDVALKRYGKRFEDELRDASLLDESLLAGMPNLSRAKGLNTSILNLIKSISRTQPRFTFDQLVKKSLIDSLHFTLEYIRLNCFKNYNQDYGTERFLDFVFGESQEWNSGKALKYLESQLKNPGFKTITKREDSMCDVETYEVPAYGNIEYKIDKEIHRIKNFFRKFNIEKGFIKQEQANLLSKIDERRRIKNYMRKLEDMFGRPQNELNDILKPVLKGKEHLFQENIKISDDLKELDNFWEKTYGDFGSYDGNTGTVELNVSRFHYYIDQKTKKMRFYGGDIYACAGHENVHNLFRVFSKNLPRGIDGKSDYVNLSERVHEEGMCLYLESTKMVDFIEEHMEEIGLSKEDIKRKRSETAYFLYKKLVPFIYAIYSRIDSIEERSDDDADEMMAKTSGCNAFRDKNFLDDYALCQVFYNSTYLYGYPRAKETFRQLNCRMKKLLGGKREANKWIAENESEIIQGALTGSWSWTTGRTFFLDLYMKELIQLREGKRVANRYDKMFSSDIEELDINTE